MNFLSSLPVFDKDLHIRRTGSWNRALNDLRYGNARWKYFSLSHPPKENDQSNSLPNAKAYITYEEVQMGIQNLVNQIESGSFLRNDEKFLKDYLLKILKDQKELAKAKEEALFNEIQSKSENKYNLFADWQYSVLVANSDNIASSQEFNKKKIASQDSIDYWTRAFYNQLNISDSYFISQKDAFALIITSYDFYQYLTKDFDRQMSIFSRHGALLSSGTAIDKDRARKLTNKIDFYALKNLYQAYNKYLNENHFMAEDTETDLAIKEKLKNAMDEVMGNYFERYDNGNFNFSKAIIKDKLQLATSVSRTIRENLEKVLKKISEEETQKARKDNTTAPKINFSIKLENNEDVWFYVSSEYGPVNMLYQNVNNKESGQDLVKNVIQVLKNCIKNFQVSDKLNLKGVQISLNNIQVQNINATGLQGIKAGAINFIDDGSIYKFLNNSYQNKEYWKSFKMANTNAFLSGFLGELSANFLTENIAKAKMTGDLYSVFGDISKKSMANVNDLSVSFMMLEGNQGRKRYNRGINIKHYVYSDNYINLYENQANFSIFNKSLSDKYLGAEDTQILRFIVENEGYFKGNESQIHNLEVKIVASHFSEFLRIHDFSRYSRYNLFFMINNVIYPTSYIYSCAIEELEQITDSNEINRLFAPQVTTSSDGSISGIKNPIEKYDNLQEARENWEEAKHELRNFVGPTIGNHDLYVQGKGLQVNLVSTTLFGNY